MSLSNAETVKIGDIIYFVDEIAALIGERSHATIVAETIRVYAIERCLQNISEACIQIQGKRTDQRFEVLFPDFDFRDIRDVGNLLRHDYGAFSYARLLDECETLVPRLKARAEDLLAAHRRLHGDSD